MGIGRQFVKMEAACLYETFFIQTTRRHIPEDCNFKVYLLFRRVRKIAKSDY